MTLDKDIVNAIASAGRAVKTDPDAPKVEQPQYTITEPTWGQEIWLSTGRVRLSGRVIWLQNNKFDGVRTDLMATFAVSFGYPMQTETPRKVYQIHANGTRIFGSAAGKTSGDLIGGGTWTFYPGSETQLQDPTIVAEHGEDSTPAFRGQMYMVIKDMPIHNFGDTLPGISAFIIDQGDGQGINIRDILTRISDASYTPYNELKDFDFFKLGGNIAYGVIITERLLFRDALNSLARFYGFDYYERTDGIVFRKYIDENGLQNPVFELTEEDMIGSSSSGATVSTVRRPDEEIPSTIELSYIDVTQQFKYNVQRARRPQFPIRTVRSERVDQFRVPLVVDASLALSGAAMALYREAETRISHSFRLPPSWIRMEPGDVGHILIKGKTWLCKIARVTINSDLTVNVEAVKLTETALDLSAYGGETSQIGIQGADPLWPEVFFLMNGEEINDGTTLQAKGQFEGAVFSVVPQWVPPDPETGAEGYWESGDGVTLSAGAARWGDGGYQLGGPTTVMDAGLSSPFNLYGEPFTMECWINTPKATGIIHGKAEGNAYMDFSYLWYFIYVPLTDFFGMGFDWNHQGVGIVNLTTDDLKDIVGKPTHIAVDRAPDGKFRLFVNGRMRGSMESTGWINSTGARVTFGGRFHSDPELRYYSSAKMDDFRFTLKSRYPHDDNFQPPTSPFFAHGTPLAPNAVTHEGQQVRYMNAYITYGA